MRGSRGEFYLRHDFFFYGSGLQSVLGLPLFAVYDILRLYIWRSRTSGDKTVRALADRGRVLSKVTQEKVAEHLGFSREHVNRLIAKLKELGWVRAVELPNTNVKAYVLGELVADSRGGKHETFFADGWLDELLAHHLNIAREEATAREAEETDPNDPGDPDDPAERKPLRYTDLSLTRRIEITRAYLNECRVCDPTITEGVIVGSQGLCAQDHSPSDRSVTQEGSDASHPRIRGKQENSEHGGGDAPRRAVLTSGGVRGALRSAPRTTEQDTEQNPSSESGENSSDFEPDELPTSDPEAQTPETRSPPRSAPPPAVPVSEPAFVTDARVEQERIAELRERHLTAQSRKDTRALTRGEVETVEEPRRAPGPKSRAADARMALLGKLEGAWLGGLRTANPGLSFASWGPAERGQVDHLVKQYGPEVVELLLRYVISEWADLNKRMLKGTGGVPTLGFVVKLHASLSFEAQRWSAIGAIKAEVDAWYAEHPNEMMSDTAPELYARYTAAVAKSEGRS